MWPILRKAARGASAPAFEAITRGQCCLRGYLPPSDAPLNHHPTAVIRPLCSLTDLLQQITETAHRHNFDAAIFELFADPVHVDFDRGIAEIAAEVREVILQLRL